MNAQIQTMLDLMDSVSNTTQNGVDKALLDYLVYDSKFNFPNRALNAFERNGITTIADLISYNKQTLRGLRYMGKGTVDQVDQCLREHGLYLGMPISEIVSNNTTPLDKLYQMREQIDFAIKLLNSLK